MSIPSKAGPRIAQQRVIAIFDPVKRPHCGSHTKQLEDHYWADCTRSPTNGQHRIILTYLGPTTSGADADRNCAVNELAHERSAQSNVALMYAVAPNSRADVFSLTQLRMYSADIRGTDRFCSDG
jgi:hypothetical protein